MILKLYSIFVLVLEGIKFTNWVSFVANPTDKNITCLHSVDVMLYKGLDNSAFKFDQKMVMLSLSL